MEPGQQYNSTDTNLCALATWSGTYRSTHTMYTVHYTVWQIGTLVCVYTMNVAESRSENLLISIIGSI